MQQATLDGGGQIVLSKTGRPFCTKCGHFLTDESHPDKTGVFRFTIWCICDCYEKFDRKTGRPIISPRYELYKRLGII